LNYPKDTIDNHQIAKVMMSFVINKSGDGEDVKVVNPFRDSFEHEAVRVISNSPKWIPGKQFGKVINVRYEIPVSFQIYN
jgi:TonB family protein